MKWAWVVLLTLASFAIAQDVHIVPRAKPQPAAVLSHDPTIRVNVNLALVNVVVTDQDGHPFSGLVQGHFRLYDDGQQQEIKHFSEDDAPVSIGLILDRSGSMGWKVDQAKSVVKAFAQQVNPQDEIFLITFADTIDSTDFASVSDEIESRMLFVDSKGKTSLLDAVYLGISKMKDAKYQRRALIIVTDGGDNHSRYTQREVERIVEEADVQIFTIGLFNHECMNAFQMNLPGMHGNGCSREEQQGPDLLSSLSRKAGGMFLLLDDPKDIQDAVDTIGRNLRQEYILGFTPHCKRHKYHKLKVKLQRLPKGTPFLHVDARQGMYEPE